MYEVLQSLDPLKEGREEEQTSTVIRGVEGLGSSRK